MRHSMETGHRVIQSFEPNEPWFWDYVAEDEVDGPILAAPAHHPLDQPTPGPAGRVPWDWEQHLH